MAEEIEDEVNSPAGLKVKCLITGKPGYLGSLILPERIKEYGTLSEVAKYYICRGAGKLLRQGLTQLETRTSLGLTNEGYVPVDDFTIEKALGMVRKKKAMGEANPNTPDANGVYWWQRDDFKVKTDWARQPINVEETTKDTCLRPDIYLCDKCEPCPYFLRCVLPIKRINGKIPKSEKI